MALDEIKQTNHVSEITCNIYNIMEWKIDENRKNCS